MEEKRTLKMRTSLIYYTSSSSSSSSSSSLSVVAAAARNKKPDPQKASEQVPPRITSNVKQNLQFLKLWKEFQKQKSNTPKPATSYRRKKAVKEELPEDTELYHDPTNLYYTNQGLDTAVPVLLVDGYNVCGYWAKLKKHFAKGSLGTARQKLIDELITFSVLKDAWIEKEVAALREDGCPKVWVVTSDACQQQAAYGAVNIHARETAPTQSRLRSG